MQPGTKQQGIDLAKSRWAHRFSFDLADETLNELFSRYRAGEILQAVKLTKHGNEPAEIYERFLVQLQRFENERNQRLNPSWPPPDVQPI